MQRMRWIQRARRTRAAAALVGLPLVFACGCADPAGSLNMSAALQEARGYLRQQLLTSQNPLVRAQAIEGMQTAPWPEAGRYVAHALSDPHRGVRFAAAMALGQIRDYDALPLLQAQLADASPTVRAAAIFALHRLGQPGHVAELARLLLYCPDTEVRRNVALIIGELGDAGAMPVLKRAMQDKDIAVKWHIQEAMARLGDAEAAERLVLFAHSGYGDERLIGILALGRTNNRQAAPSLQDMIRRSNPIEVKLAAIRSLGMLGASEGINVARKALTWTPPSNEKLPSPQPADVRQVRIRSMAALALGEAGDEAVVPDLLGVMRRDEPRVAVAAAAAVLRIASRQNVATPSTPPGP